MALTTPTIIAPILPFPANTAQTIGFTSTGGNQVTGNTINVYKVSDNSLVYTSTVTSFLLQNTIAANSLINGTQYKVTITTVDINNNTSNPSDSVTFWVLSNPTLTITNIDVSGKVYNQNVTFSATYSQAQSEILQSYIYNLYDSNQSLIQSYPNVFANGSSPLTQLISNLANATLYYVQVKTVSAHGQLGDSGLIGFTPQYISPSLYSTVTTTSIPTTGSINVQALILQETGKMDTGTAIYQNSTWIDLTQGGQVSFQNGFNIPSSNFVTKIWCKNIPLDTVFCKLYAPYGRIELHMEVSEVHAKVYLTNSTISNHYISNTLQLSDTTLYDDTMTFDDTQDFQVWFNTMFNAIQANQPFMIYIKSQYNCLDLYLTLV